MLLAESHFQFGPRQQLIHDLISRLCRRFEHVIRDARIGTRHPIENVLEWKSGIFATGFAGIEEVAQVL